MVLLCHYILLDFSPGYDYHHSVYGEVTCCSAEL